jgi:hypothetical protein
MELEIIVSYTKWRYLKIHRSGCYMGLIFIDTSTDLCFLTGSRRFWKQQSLENREDQDAADLKAHALTKEIFLELLLVFLLGAKDSSSS